MKLTKPQQLIYNMEKFVGGSIAVICCSLLMPKKYEISEMKRALNEVYRLNDALRLSISENEDGVNQEIEEFREREIDVLRFNSREELDEYGRKYAKEPFDLYGRLCELKIVILPGRCGVLAKAHHIVGDAWSMSLISNHLIAILNGEAPDTYSYKNYVESEQEYLSGPRYGRDREYFVEQFQKCDEVTYLSEKRSDSFGANRISFIIDKQTTKKITDYAASRGASAFMLLTAAISAYISRVKMNAEKFFIGTAVLNRASAKEKNTAGMFINTVPMLIELSNEKSFSENLSGIKNTTFPVFRHQKYNYGDVLNELRSRFGFGEKLYDVLVSYQNATIGGGTDTTWYPCGMQTESLQIHIDDRDKEGVFRVHYDYLTKKFSEYEIEVFHTHIFNLLFSAIENDKKKICELDFLTADEKKKILAEFNNTAVDYPKDKCVHELFEEQAAKAPDKTAVIACDRTLTYGELNEEANKIAHSLIEKGAGAGDIVAFALPRKSYLISVILGILKSGAAYLPIDPDYPQDRIEYMLSDSNAKIFITEADIGKLTDNKNVLNPNVAVSGEDLCYCIYTSGSTGSPKGIAVKNRCVANYVNNNRHNVIDNIIKGSYHSIVSVTTVCFDIFITESILPLSNGLEVVLANEEQSRIPKKLNELLKIHPVDVLQTTPSRIKSLISDDKHSDNFKSLKAIIIGGEALDEALIKSLKLISDANIFNIYGPAETTVWSAFAQIKDSDDISIGKPIANTQIYVVDKYLNPVPPGVTGELCIAGDGVGAGYLNLPELTAEKFIENPFGEGKLYKTGDLAYLRDDGNIVFVGRNDFQVKIRGLRVEPGEIENAISSVEGISQSVVVVRRDNEGRQLICAFYTGNVVEPKEIRAKVSRKLPKYMLPHIFTHLDTMPLTTSGKINRKALPKVDLYAIDTTVEYIAPHTEQEKVLCTAIETVLKIEKIGIADNFFDLGGDSLKAIELISKLEKSGYHTDTKTIFACVDIRELAEKLTAAVTEDDEHLDYPAQIPATHAQMRVYIAQSMDADSTMYNVPYAFRAKEVDTDRLQKAINALLLRHDILRTYFENRGGTVVQCVDENAECKVEKLKDCDIASFVRPFDLSTAPLVRVGVYQNTVIIDIHHIITDGGSLPILLYELNELYMGRAIESSPVPYKRFAVTLQDHTESEKYWLSVYEDELPELTVNTDFGRGQKRSFSGGAVYDAVDIELHNKIESYCRRHSITPYVYYTAAFNILLSKFSGCEDIAVGIPISGRNGKFLNTIGMFVNTIALRSKPVGTKPVNEFLSEVKENSVKAIEHQNYPFGELVNKLAPGASNRNPLFDFMFAYQSENLTDITFGDEKAEILPVPVASSKYDLTFNVLPRVNDVVIMAEYCTALYKENTVRRFINGFKQLLAQMLEGTKEIRNISAILPDEKQKILIDFNDTDCEFPKDETVYSLFQKRSEKNENVVCITHSTGNITFGEFRKMAEKTDRRIRSRTNKKCVVGVIADRSPEMLAAIYGIIRGGNAYVPISPDYPKERIENMVSDSGCAVVLCQRKYRDFSENTVCIEDVLDEENDRDIPSPALEPDDILYVIYTSGSTGKPKGAAVKCRSVMNRINWMQRIYPMTDGDTIMFKTPFTFDVSVWEIFRWGMFAGKLHILPPGEHYVQSAVLSNIITGNVTDIHFVPSVFKAFVSCLESSPEEIGKLSTLKNIFLSGETLTPSLINRFNALKGQSKVKIHNLYGPTECAVDVTSYDCGDTEQGAVPIGKPIDNTQIYIIDKYLNPVPLGVTGELCIAGENVGAGYIGDKKLTEEKFVDNPFGKGRLYKTGDLAYLRYDGNIVHVGRKDGQIKLSGQRIETGEIESAVSDIDGITDCAVMLKRSPDMLVSFYTGKIFAEKELRKMLVLKLPRYMIPSRFIHIDALPINSNGKADRAALALVDVPPLKGSEYNEPPQNALEAEICELFAKELKSEEIYANTNLMDAGGTSLNMVSLLASPLLNGMTAEDFMRDPTPAGIAKKLSFTESDDSLVPIYTPDSADSAYILFSYAGGNSSAYVAMATHFRKIRSSTALYFVPWTADVHRSAYEIERLAEKIKVGFYSHCAGAVKALKILDIINAGSEKIKVFIAGGNIPPGENDMAENGWRKVDDGVILGVLKKAGMDTGDMTDGQIREMMRAFRENTDEYVGYFSSKKNKTVCSLTAIISREDIFTENYESAEENWSQYVTNFEKVILIDSESHYFQNTNTSQISDILLEKIAEI